MRGFSAFYLLLRFLLLLILSTLESVFYLPVMAFVVALSALLISLCRPYVRESQNKLDVAVMLMMIVLYLALTSSAIASFLTFEWIHFSQHLLGLALILFAAVVTGSVFWSFGCNVCKWLARRLKSWWMLLKKMGANRGGFETENPSDAAGERELLFKTP